MLVVDDDADARIMLGLLLESRGYAVALAADGLEALEVLRVQSPDAVVSDMNMPRLDGLALCRAVRELGSDSPVPFVVWSSVAPDDDRVRETRALGGVEVIGKSQAVVDVDVALRRLLESKLNAIP